MRGFLVLVFLHLSLAVPLSNIPLGTTQELSHTEFIQFLKAGLVDSSVYDRESAMYLHGMDSSVHEFVSMLEESNNEEQNLQNLVSVFLELPPSVANLGDYDDGGPEHLKSVGAIPAEELPITAKLGRVIPDSPKSIPSNNDDILGDVELISKDASVLPNNAAGSSFSSAIPQQFSDSTANLGALTQTVDDMKYQMDQLERFIKRRLRCRVNPESCAEAQPQRETKPKEECTRRFKYLCRTAFELTPGASSTNTGGAATELLLQKEMSHTSSPKPAMSAITMASTAPPKIHIAPDAGLEKVLAKQKKQIEDQAEMLRKATAQIQALMSQQQAPVTLHQGSVEETGAHKASEIKLDVFSQEVNNEAAVASSPVDMAVQETPATTEGSETAPAQSESAPTQPDSAPEAITAQSDSTVETQAQSESTASIDSSIGTSDVSNSNAAAEQDNNQASTVEMTQAQPAESNEAVAAAPPAAAPPAEGTEEVAAQPTDVTVESSNVSPPVGETVSMPEGDQARVSQIANPGDDPVPPADPSPQPKTSETGSQKQSPSLSLSQTLEEAQNVQVALETYTNHLVGSVGEAEAKKRAFEKERKAKERENVHAKAAQFAKHLLASSKGGPGHAQVYVPERYRDINVLAQLDEGRGDAVTPRSVSRHLAPVFPSKDFIAKMAEAAYASTHASRRKGEQDSFGLQSFVEEDEGAGANVPQTPAPVQHMAIRAAEKHVGEKLADMTELLLDSARTCVQRDKDSGMCEVFDDKTRCLRTDDRNALCGFTVEGSSRHFARVPVERLMI